MIQQRTRNKTLHRKTIRHIRKNIFIHIPKTGGTYITNRFKHLGLLFSDTVHTPACFIKKEYGDNYSKGISFTFVRNPYERFLSACKHNKVHLPSDIELLSELIVKGDIDWASKFSIFHYEHFFTQKHFITDFDNQTIIVDFIGKYETFKEDIFKLSKLGIDLTSNFKIKKNVSSNWKDILTNKTKENIVKIYKEDFEILGYNKI
jgi:hypothetical protein